MKTISFTQYMRPDGRPVPVEIDRPDEIAAKAEQIVDAGYRFELEHLQTGHASLTIFDPDKEEDVAIRVVPNGPEVIDAVDEMIQEFDIP